MLALALCISSAAFSELHVFADEPLTDGQTVARVSGGVFNAEGWRSITNLDNLVYALPEGTKAGSCTYEVKGFAVNVGSGDPRQHVWGIYNVLADNYIVKQACHGHDGITFRYWYKLRDGTQPGTVRYRVHGASYIGGTSCTSNTGGRVQANKGPLAWDPNKWYKFQFTWSATRATWSRDSQDAITLNYPDKNVSFRYLHINNDNHFDMHGRAGLTYRNIIVMADIAVMPSEKKVNRIKFGSMRIAPNPFTDMTGIWINPQGAGNIEVSIFNPVGCLIKSLTCKDQIAGNHRLVWNGTDRDSKNVPNGIYLVQYSRKGKAVMQDKVIYMK
jgi:hypothetical protein